MKPYRAPLQESPAERTARRHIASVLAVLLSVSLLLAGCGERESSTPDFGTLRAADILDGMRTLFVAAGEDQPEDYRIEWSNFVSGPPIIAAATGGSIDVGWMADTPLVFAQATGSPIKVIGVATQVNPGGGVGLAVAEDSPIRSIEDLRGKRVSYLPGTILQYVLIQWLEQAGLTINDIQTVAVTSGSSPGFELLQQGSVDAVVLLEPSLSRAQAQGGIHLLLEPDGTIDAGMRYLVAPAHLLEDPLATDLLEDFLARVSRAYQWQADHFDEAADVLARLYRMPSEQTSVALGRTLTRIVPIDDDIIARHQRQIDTFVRAGLLRRPFDARDVFDTRFNDIALRNRESPGTQQDTRGKP